MIGNRLLTLFHRAMECSPGEREAFLDRECTTDPELLSELRRLIEQDESADSADFIGEPALHVEARAAARQGLADQTGALYQRYRIESPLGEGGMGEVYLAVDTELNRQVALKTVRGFAGTEELLRRFGAERQILAQLNHEYIARLLDIGAASDGRPFLVMEYVEGIPINQYVADRKLPLGQILALFRKVCAAVAYAHQKLVVHRDLKPANILVTPDGTPKLLDFGIAKLLDDTGQRTQTMVALTPEYASPEQVLGSPISTASDVYSLGVLLYELLTGSRPFRKPSGTLEWVRTITTEAPHPLRQAAGRSFDPDLENIVQVALRKEPERRYSSVERLAEDIDRHQRGYPVSARPDTRGYRLSRFVRRNKLAIAAVASIAVLLIGGGTATAWEARIANRRFNDVRKLANSYLFEFHDAIRDLPGSTAARQLVVKRALEYLDSLAQEKGNDRELANELAAAYEKVGMVQGGTGASLGDGAGALASFRKALAIRERLVAAAPSDLKAAVSLATLRLSSARLLQARVDLKSASAMATAALTLLEQRSARNAGSTELDSVLADAYLTMGDIAGNNDFVNLGDAKRALELYEKSARMRKSLISRKPKDREQRMELGVAYGRIANVRASLYDLKGTADAFRTAIEIDEGLVRDDPLNVVYRRELAVYSRSLSLSLVRLKDLDGAQTAGDRSAALFEQLAKEDPKNVAAREAVADSMVSQGYLLSMKKRFPEALERYQAGVGIYDELVASRRGNTVVSLRVAHQLIGQTAILTRDAALLLRSAQKQLEMDEGMLRADPNNVNPQRSQAVAWYQMGKAHELMAGNAAGDRRTAELREAKRWYLRSADMWTMLEKQRKLIPSYKPRQQETQAALLNVQKALIKAKISP